LAREVACERESSIERVAFVLLATLSLMASTGSALAQDVMAIVDKKRPER